MTTNQIETDVLGLLLARLQPVLAELRLDPAIDAIDYAAAVAKMGMFMQVEAAEIRKDATG